MLEKFWSYFKTKKNHKGIFFAAAILAAASFLSRLLGILRSRVLAGKFGAGDTLDAYYAAFRIPDFVFHLIVLGALSAAFIPVFTLYLQKEDKKEAWQLASIVLNFTILAVTIISAILFFFAPWLIFFIAPGFSGEKRELAVLFTRIMFLSPLFLGVSNVFSGILNSFKRFVAYAIAPLFYNLGIIFGAIFFVPCIGLSGLAWGVALGAFLHMLVQLPSVLACGFHYSFILDLKNKGVKKIGKLILPRMMGLAANQINLLFITFLASFLSAGSVAVFNLANDLQYFPIGIIGLSFAIAAFPSLAENFARDESQKFKQNLSSAVKQILYLIIPVSIFMLVFRAQIVRLILGTGHFDWEDTKLTLNALGFFALSIFAQSLIPLLARAFFALQDTITPLLASMASIVLNLILGFYLSSKIGVAGLALAFSVHAIFNMVILIYFLYRRLGGIDGGNLLSFLLKVIIASLLSGFLGQWLKTPLSLVFDTHTGLGLLFQTILALGGGFLLYLLLSWFLKIEEISTWLKAWRRF